MQNEDRADIELERDRQQGAMRDNYYAELKKTIPDQPFSEDAEQGIKVSDIVKKLVRRGGGNAFYYNHQIYWDMDLSEAAQEASLDCITPEGWDTPVTGLEQINVYGHAPQTHEYEITVEVYPE